MIESCVLGPKTGPERWAGYQTNIPPTPVYIDTSYRPIKLSKARPAPKPHKGKALHELRHRRD